MRTRPQPRSSMRTRPRRHWSPMRTRPRRWIPMRTRPRRRSLMRMRQRPSLMRTRPQRQLRHRHRHRPLTLVIKHVRFAKLCAPHANPVLIRRKVSARSAGIAGTMMTISSKTRLARTVMLWMRIMTGMMMRSVALAVKWIAELAGIQIQLHQLLLQCLLALALMKKKGMEGADLQNPSLVEMVGAALVLGLAHQYHALRRHLAAMGTEGADSHKEARLPLVAMEGAVAVVVMEGVDFLLQREQLCTCRHHGRCLVQHNDNSAAAGRLDRHGCISVDTWFYLRLGNFCYRLIPLTATVPSNRCVDNDDVFLFRQGSCQQ